MKTRAKFTLGLSALVMVGAMAGVATQHGGIAFASARNESQAEKQAASEAAKAQNALAKGKADQAVRFAETAVGLRPQVAAFRMLLGSSYLKAGRFESARQTFADAVSIEPSNGKAALNLALAQIATGDWGAARKTLDAHSDTIPVSDRGLAMALAGDPASAVELLNAAARTPDADAKTRQNLALSLALAGRWQDARTVVAVDLAPGEVDQRILQWAAFARPTSASDQVASLLGVTPVQDAGQPTALALNISGPAMAAGSLDSFMPGQAKEAVAVAQNTAAPTPAPEVAVAEAPAAAAPEPAQVSAPAFASVQFGPRQEVVQAVPSAVAEIRPAVARTTSDKVAPVAVATRAPAKGNFFVQLGAYDNAGVAKNGWAHAIRADARFASHTPSSMTINAKGTTFYRLSVGGFARADAVALCRSYKAKGGDCFVRAGAGDQIASWVRPARQQLASR